MLLAMNSVVGEKIRKVAKGNLASEITVGTRVFHKSPIEF